MAKNMNPTKVITGKDTRWSYCNIWDAKSINGGTPKYSVSLIIPKADTVTVQKIRAAIEAAYRDGESKLRGNGKTVPPLVAIKNPLRDGDTERPDDPAYAGAYFVNANSATAPGVVDAACNPILTRSEVYSGVYGRASISFYAFNSNGNRGIACGPEQPAEDPPIRISIAVGLPRRATSRTRTTKTSCPDGGEDND